MDFNFFKIADRLLVDWVNKNAQLINIQKESCLINESKMLNSIFILVSGSLEVIKSVKDSDPLILSTLNEGAMIGEMSFMLASNPSASVISKSEIEILKIDFHLLRNEFSRNKSLSMSFYKLISIKLCYQLLTQNKLIGYSHSKYNDDREPLRKFISLFSSLNEIDIDWISQKSKLITFEKDDFVINQGEILNYVYIVLSGKGDVLINVDEQNKTVGISKRGELLGETSMLVEEQKYASASIKAITQMDILAISRNTLYEKIYEDIDFAIRFYKGLAIMLSQRSRDQLKRLDIEFQFYEYNNYDIKRDFEEDELNLELMSSISKASNHFDRLCNQLYST
ncbi:cyclic nucleotide-binding domain-containing protein [Prochlorococcus marinus]|uniref:cyclic nucleotide-binding domain-containing protein n=1 Tax=Prochlorococcus marinus TaxID=1219 RepID=UPI0022B39229|nr:cyclic nucleotide-binding domain-containing protein [Prochlorococcus marinus]